MFIKNPNLPQYDVRGVLIDYRAEYIFEKFDKLGIKVFKTPKLNIAYRAVSGHPDMLFHHVNENSSFVSPESYEYFTKLFPNENIISGNKKIKNTYPDDVAYNIARIDNFAILNEKYSEENILEYYKKNGVKLINVKQGYSKCSVCIVSDNAIITSDKSILKNAQLYGINALLIRPGYVKLKDLPYGFIGGASGLISKGILAFNGNIKKHSDYKEIKDFCLKFNVKAMSLHDDELEDIGSIIPIY